MLKSLFAGSQVLDVENYWKPIGACIWTLLRVLQEEQVLDTSKLAAAIFVISIWCQCSFLEQNDFKN